MPDVRLAYRPFPEQMAFFERKLPVPTNGWQDLWLSDHAHGFMVAGANRAALVEDFHRTIARLMREGRGLDDFRAEFEQIVQRHGWTGWAGEGSEAGRAWRTRIIWETNLYQSYNAGRYAQLTHPDMVAARPYWQYRHNDRGISRNPRPQHQAWNGLILRWDDPWWRTHFPANGWGCKCGVRALSEGDLRRQGLRVGTAPDTGTAGIDPGFEYNVGAARSMPAAASFGQRVAQLPPRLRGPALDDAQQRGVDWLRDFQPLLEQRAMAPVGWMRRQAMERWPSLPSALLAMPPGRLRTVPGARAGLVEQLASAVAIARTTEGRLAYLWRQDGEWIAAIFNADEQVEGITALWLLSVGAVTPAELRAWTLLEGSISG